MSVEAIQGTSYNSFDIGDNGQNAIIASIVNDAGVLKFVDQDGNPIRTKGKFPTEADDYTTKKYAESLNPRILREADCSSAIPNNTAVAGWLLVTTPGSGAAAGSILYDNGADDSNAMEIFAPDNARVISVALSFTSGTIKVDANSLYHWDNEGGSWVKSGDIGSVTGAERTIIISFGKNDTPSKEADNEIPTGNYVTFVGIRNTEVYVAGRTISVGHNGNQNYLMSTTENNPRRLRYYKKNILVPWTFGKPKAYLDAASATGSSLVIIKFTANLS